MNKSELLHKISNKMVLPMSVLEMVVQMGPKCRKAQDQIREMIQEIKKGLNDAVTDE